MSVPILSSCENGRNLMQLLAADEELSDFKLDGDHLIKKSKLFVIAQVKNELSRVIKMTDFLDKLEAKFMNAVDNRLEQNPDNLQLISSAMETVTNSLNRSNSLISQVLKDEKLSALIINTTNIITPGGASSTVMDIDSRDAVRNMASSLLSQLATLSNNENVIDVSEQIIPDTTEEDPNE